MTKHSKQEQLLIQKDEQLIKELLHNLYERKLKGGGLSGLRKSVFARIYCTIQGVWRRSGHGSTWFGCDCKHISKRN